MGSRKFDRLTLKLGIGVAAVVICGVAAGSYLIFRHYKGNLLRSTREHAAMDTGLIRMALEHQMLEKDRRLIRWLVNGFARERSVQRVMILDRKGVVKFSSDPEIHNHHFKENAPTCQVCHRRPAPNRSRSTMLEVRGGKVLRVVEPIPNRKTCHRCHNPAHRINGLIVVDVPLGRTLKELEKGVTYLALGTVVIGLLLLGGIGFLFRRLVMKRLGRFEATARAIAHGDLDKRVPVDTHDGFTRVEKQFNRMADSVSDLLSQLREQRASLEKVMNSVDDGMVVLDPSRRIVAANEAFARRFPDGGSNPIGRTCCAPPDSGGLACGRSEKSHGECPTLKSFATGKVQLTIRTRTDAGGASRQEEVLASPVFAPDGTVSQVVEVWRDITNRRSAEAKMADYQRMISLGILASGFSHEVNTPLASIETCLESIKGLKPRDGPLVQEDWARLEEYVRIASTQVERCGGITQQFLKLARGKSLDRDIVDLWRSASTIVALCTHTARDAGIPIELKEPPGLPLVLANESAVQQVLLNLTLNAIEASEDGSPVTLSFRPGDPVEVLVEDEGRGIPPEDLTRVFEPFFTRREEGIGLGLFVSMNLARGWGGDILVERRPNKGTVFRVLFPTVKPGEEKHDAASQHSRRG